MSLLHVIICRQRPVEAFPLSNSPTWSYVASCPDTKMAASLSADRPKREMRALVMGLPRTGSASMAAALTILGFKDVYHALQSIDHPEQAEFFNRAAMASFPNLPDYTGKPFTQQDWDELYGPCEASTDIAGIFGATMVRAYPEAKVILTTRDFDRWAKSVEESVLVSLWGPAASFSINIVERILGTVHGVAMRKVTLGLFQANDVDEARRNMRATYDRHHREIREATPPGQLLEYRMGDGWEPLCEFLGQPVPDVEFPWVNENAALRAVVKDKIQRNLKAAAKVIAPWAIGAAAVAGGLLWTRYR